MARLVEGRNQEEAGYQAWVIVVKGVVQGVGFRPFVYRLAHEYGVNGTVANTGDGVTIHVEGTDLDGFCLDLKLKAPPLSRISTIEWQEIPFSNFKGFQILKSHAGFLGEALIPPDIAVCPDCLSEVYDSSDRHYGYPFTNCTNCGPRFTITEALPYDRAKTTMKGFSLCPECNKEYEDPLDRRFHAQPVTCPDCGPKLWLEDSLGNLYASPLEMAKEFLNQGKIIAIKGIGGFHLACDATNIEAVNLLRERKRRPKRPFALMVRDLSIAKAYCYVSKEEEELLKSPKAPIVLLKKRQETDLAEGIAPGLDSLGVMLPYSPLHHLLLEEKPLVMTSGNLSGLPLVKDNEEAKDLAQIADAFLFHDRDILNHCDDSVLRVVSGEPLIYRRSRGYVPMEISVFKEKHPIALGAGGEDKNTFALLVNGKAYLSQHLGNMSFMQGIKVYQKSLDHFMSLFGTPEVIGYDPHPEYLITKYVKESFSTLVPVQHHHAHLVSCLAEHQLLEEKAIGLILDGTGYGDDGNLWGFEVLLGDRVGYERYLHLEYLSLPGGEAAIKYPLRATAAALGRIDRLEWLIKLRPEKEEEINLSYQISEKGLNTSLASSAGRLFDIVAVLSGVCFEATYDGEPAIVLSERITDRFVGIYPYSIEKGTIHVSELLEAVCRDVALRESPETISRRFHDTLVEILVDAALQVRRDTGVNLVALSGGVFQNPYLARVVPLRLKEYGFRCISHRLVPPNDGGISLGQAVIAQSVR